MGTSSSEPSGTGSSEVDPRRGGHEVAPVARPATPGAPPKARRGARELGSRDPSLGGVAPYQDMEAAEPVRLAVVRLGEALSAAHVLDIGAGRRATEQGLGTRHAGPSRAG